MDLATSSLWLGTIYERISIAGQLLEAAGHGLLPQKVIWDDVGILWYNFYNFALTWSNMNLGTLGLSGHRPRQCMTFALLNHFASPFVSLCVGWVQYPLWVLFQTTFNAPPQTETGTDTVWQFDRLTRYCTVCQTHLNSIDGSGVHTVWHVKCS